MQKTYAIFGLGRYGIAVAKELIKHGAEVLAVDENPDTVNAVADKIPFCKCADVTDPEVINQLGIANIDTVIISMANNLESSVMATTLCKEVGVKTVIAKCANEMHQKILLKIGADKAIIPENESGTRLAKNLLSSNFVDMIELAEDIAVVAIDVIQEWEGKTLIELNLRQKYAINVIAIQQNGKLTIDIDPTKPFTKDMKLVIIGDPRKTKKLAKALATP